MIYLVGNPASIPDKSNSYTPGTVLQPYSKRRYRRRGRIEIMFGRLKDWRRVATRSDRCPTAFFAATVIFRL